MARRALPTLVTLLLVGLAPPGPLSSQDTVRSIEVEARKYDFRPSRIEVTEGETVRITVRSVDSKHGFGIDELGIEEDVPRSGRPVTIEFVADKAGEFAIKCTEWCGKGHKRMKGLLVVRPREGTR